MEYLVGDVVLLNVSVFCLFSLLSSDSLRVSCSFSCGIKIKICIKVLYRLKIKIEYLPDVPSFSSTFNSTV